MSVPHPQAAPRARPRPSSENPPEPRRAPVACFSILATAEPGVMPRVLELFAKRGLVPSRWVSDVAGPGGRELSIDVQVAGMEREAVGYVARCLRQLWGVDTVLTSEKGGPR